MKQVHIRGLQMFLLRLQVKTTGESHIVVTDKNSRFSTASNWASHKRNTNAREIQRGRNLVRNFEPDDSKGALLYDTYEIEELAVNPTKVVEIDSSI